ncbi:MAG: hypothetical protein Q8R35_02990 [bacterium]|nr:hypothetical protein [bacterium]
MGGSLRERGIVHSFSKEKVAKNLEAQVQILVPQYAIDKYHSDVVFVFRSEFQKKGGNKVGTRADFYVGRPTADGWLGSIAYDGYPQAKNSNAGVPRTLLAAETEARFREQVTSLLASREDATTRANGWPWPWEDSGTTDCGYAFFEGHVWMARSRFWGVRGKRWSNPLTGRLTRIPIRWPDMRSRANVAGVRSPRSGLLALKVF